MKGLIVFVYRSADGSDCSGGLSSKHTSFVLVGPGIPEIFEPTYKTPPLLLKSKNIGGVYWYAEPTQPVERGNVGYMFGGNFVYTSDSRFGEVVGGSRPIAIHDRQDTYENYIRLTT